MHTLKLHVEHLRNKVYRYNTNILRYAGKIVMVTESEEELQ